MIIDQYRFGGEVNIADYQLNGNANDSSGNGYDGVLGDGVTPATFPDSVLGDTAYQFNGSTQYISLPNNSIVDNLRLRFRIKHDSVSSRQFYCGYADAPGNCTFYAVQLLNSNTLVFNIGNANVMIVSYVTDLNWHTHDITYKQRTATAWDIDWLIDDISVYSSSTNVDLGNLAQDASFRLGRFGLFSSLFFNGIMDYFIISENV